MRIRSVVLSATLTTAVAMAFAPLALAASPKPSDRACSNGSEKYACLTVSTRSASVSETVSFAGTLSSAAMRNLKSWTKGTNTVCLDRYAAKAAADGSWGGTQLSGACTTVRGNGGFTINAQLGRVGTYDYGVSMGPCRASKAECGNGDPGLVGVAGPTVVQLTTTP